MMRLHSLLCLLSTWIGLSSTQEIRPGPGEVNVSEGEDALLPCALGSGQSINKFDWRKDNGKEEKTEVFMYNRGSHYRNGLKGQSEQFTERVEFFQHELKSGNASIIIQKTRLEDNGTYTCVLFEPHRHEFNIKLNVGAAPVPYIKPIQHEITWSLLECKAKGIPNPEVEWRNSAGQVLTKHKADSKNGLSHVKLEVNVTKSDNYTCVATQWGIFHQINNTMEVSIPDVVAVSEGEDAVLPCVLNSKETFESMEFTWKKGDMEIFFYNRSREEQEFTGRLTLFQSELKFGNASIKIHNTQITDSGRYICHSPNMHKSHVILQVVGHATGLIVTVAVVITSAILLLVFGIIIAVLSARIRSLKNPTPRPESEPLNDIK